jgi:hypothetical protein
MTTKPYIKIVNDTGHYTGTKVYFYDRNGRRHDLTEVGIEEVDIQPITVHNQMTVKIRFVDPRLQLKIETSIPCETVFDFPEEDFRMMKGIPEND